HSADTGAGAALVSAAAPGGGLPTPPMDAATGLPVGYPLRRDWEITPKELAGLLEQGLPDGAVLLDCRRDDEFAFNRLPGAVQIEMNQTEKRADELESPDGGRGHPVYVYCHHGRRSLQVAATLRALGFRKAVSLAGGIDAWSMGIDPSVPRY
ncbi:MAG TPA: rhodanese-like domain-containing protein, partial [Phycisphaerales bacterium]|nr:rhodanese-like domain-containing protein [Phycisphaerales bacterium]